MKQDRIKKTEPQKATDKIEELRKEFEKVKKKAQFRKVRLLYSSCCGCGCYDVTIERTVPEDSDLRDGDRAYDHMDGDKLVDDDD